MIQCELCMDVERNHSCVERFQGEPCALHQILGRGAAILRHINMLTETLLAQPS
jgi:hypothetical protein